MSDADNREAVRLYDAVACDTPACYGKFQSFYFDLTTVGAGNLYDFACPGMEGGARSLSPGELANGAAARTKELEHDFIEHDAAERLGAAVREVLCNPERRRDYDDYLLWSDAHSVAAQFLAPEYAPLSSAERKQAVSALRMAVKDDAVAEAIVSGFELKMAGGREAASDIGFGNLPGIDNAEGASNAWGEGDGQFGEMAWNAESGRSVVSDWGVHDTPEASPSPYAWADEGAMGGGVQRSGGFGASSGAPTDGWPTAQPIAQQVAQPMAQPIAQPIGQPFTQQIGQPMAQPIAQPIAGQPTAQPMAQPIAQQVAQPMAQPIAQPMVQPTQPAEKPREKAGGLAKSVKWILCCVVVVVLMYGLGSVMGRLQSGGVERWDTETSAESEASDLANGNSEAVPETTAGANGVDDMLQGSGEPNYGTREGGNYTSQELGFKVVAGDHVKLSYYEFSYDQIHGPTDYLSYNFYSDSGEYVGNATVSISGWEFDDPPDRYLDADESEVSVDVAGMSLTGVAGAYEDSDYIYDIYYLVDGRLVVFNLFYNKGSNGDKIFLDSVKAVS